MRPLSLFLALFALSVGLLVAPHDTAPQHVLSTAPVAVAEAEALPPHPRLIVASRSRTKPVPKRAVVRKHFVRHRAKRLAAVPTSSLKAYAFGLVGAAQFSCLEPLWQHESNWEVSNSYGSAYGIPQALPGSKMASEGSDWRTNGRTQIRWGVSYIAGRYGNACSAWAHYQAHSWY